LTAIIHGFCFHDGKWNRSYAMHVESFEKPKSSHQFSTLSHERSIVEKETNGAVRMG
jgi:hypothetical protein